MSRCSCHFILLEYLHVADLARIVEGYAHRKHIHLPSEITVSSRDVSITMIQIENGYTLSFAVKTQHLTDQKWDVVGEHKMGISDVNVVAHDVFTPRGWLHMSAAIWEDQRAWAMYRLKFKRAIQKLRKRLRKLYERYAHELVKEYLLVYALAYNLLYILSGSRALHYE